MPRSASCPAPQPAAAPEPWLHDPDARVPVLRVGDWEVRALRRGSPRFRRLHRRGGLHVQLWDPAAGVSVVTPSALTGQRFEICRRGDRPIAVPRPPQLHGTVADLGAAPLPTMREIALLADWFTRAGRRGRGAGPAAGGCAAGAIRRSPTPRRQRSQAPGAATAGDPLHACAPAALRLLVVYLAVSDPAALARIAPVAEAAPTAAPGQGCGTVVAAFAAALRSAAVRRELDRQLAARLGAGVRPLRSLCLADLADAWHREVASGARGARLAALLWAIARRPEACVRKLEAKVCARIEESRHWLLLDADAALVLADG